MNDSSWNQRFAELDRRIEVRRRRRELENVLEGLRTRRDALRELDDVDGVRMAEEWIRQTEADLKQDVPSSAAPPAANTSEGHTERVDIDDDVRPAPPPTPAWPDLTPRLQKPMTSPPPTPTPVDAEPNPPSSVGPEQPPEEPFNPESCRLPEEARLPIGAVPDLVPPLPQFFRHRDASSMRQMMTELEIVFDTLVAPDGIEKLPLPTRKPTVQVYAAWLKLLDDENADLFGWEQTNGTVYPLDTIKRRLFGRLSGLSRDGRVGGFVVGLSSRHSENWRKVLWEAECERRRAWVRVAQEAALEMETAAQEKIATERQAWHEELMNEHLPAITAAFQARQRGEEVDLPKFLKRLETLASEKVNFGPILPLLEPFRADIKGSDLRTIRRRLSTATKAANGTYDPDKTLSIEKPLEDLAHGQFEGFRVLVFGGSPTPEQCAALVSDTGLTLEWVNATGHFKPAMGQLAAGKYDLLLTITPTRNEDEYRLASQFRGAAAKGGVPYQRCKDLTALSLKQIILAFRMGTESK